MKPEEVYICYVYIVGYDVRLTNKGFVGRYGEEYNNRLSSLGKYIVDKKAYIGWDKGCEDHWKIDL